ncbi:Reverse transcriptase domain, partial [Trinorchestia longiramus]
LPAKYQINSTDEFLQIIRASRPQGIITSLDVESLFTNVPVLPTIDIICETVYKDPTAAPPIVEANLLKKLSIVCTTECPFFHVDGTMYLQTDGVSMGSPLGVTMANFYMTALENKILESSTDMKPHTYCRYVDDCFIVIDNIQSLEELKNSFE